MSLQLRQSSHLPGARGCPARPASKKPDNTGRAIAREDLEDKQRNGSLAARVPARGRHPSMVAPRTRTQGPRQAPPFFCLLLLLLILLLQLPGGQTRLRDTRHSAAAPEAFCWRFLLSLRAAEVEQKKQPQRGNTCNVMRAPAGCSPGLADRDGARGGTTAGGASPGAPLRRWRHQLLARGWDHRHVSGQPSGRRKRPVEPPRR